MKILFQIILLTSIFYCQPKIISTVFTQTELRTEPSILGKVITLIQPGDSLEFLDFDDAFYLAKYKDTCGYVISNWINNIDSVRYYLKIKKGINPLIPEPTYKEKQIEKYLQRNPQISESFKSAIRAEMLELGMDREMVEYAWGKPNEKNRSVGSWGIHEQWVYEKDGKYRFAYFENGILTGWQE